MIVFFIQASALSKGNGENGVELEGVVPGRSHRVESTSGIQLCNLYTCTESSLLASEHPAGEAQEYGVWK